MVSKASELLPEPERPVTTVRVLRGMETEMFFRLCWRAPRTVMCVMGARGGDLGEVAKLLGYGIRGHQRWLPWGLLDARKVSTNVAISTDGPRIQAVREIARRGMEVRSPKESRYVEEGSGGETEAGWYLGSQHCGTEMRLPPKDGSARVERAFGTRVGVRAADAGR